MLQGRKEDPSPGLLQLSSCRMSLPGPKPEQCRGPAVISARSQLFAPHRREPEFHHNSFSTVSILSLAPLWPQSGTHVTHPHYLFARILSQQAFPIPESGAKIIRFNVLSKWFGSIKQTDTRGILTALCLSLWGLWPPVFPYNWEIQIVFKVWGLFIKKRKVLTYSCDSGN